MTRTKQGIGGNADLRGSGCSARTVERRKDRGARLRQPRTGACVEPARLRLRRRRRPAPGRQDVRHGAARRPAGEDACRGREGRRARRVPRARHGAGAALQGHRAEPQEGRDAAVRARLQHSLQADSAARRPRRRADRAEGTRRPRAPPVRAGSRRAVSARGRAGCDRQSASARPRLRARHRRHARRRA